MKARRNEDGTANPRLTARKLGVSRGALKRQGHDRSHTDAELDALNASPPDWLREERHRQQQRQRAAEQQRTDVEFTRIAETERSFERARTLASLAEAGFGRPVSPRFASPKSPERYVRNRPGRVDWITKPILQARGWTDAGIRDHLPDPEAWMQNPHYSTAGAPMPVWSPAEVATAESTELFQQWLARSLRRRRTTLDALGAVEDPDTRQRFADADAAIAAAREHSD